ncbi:hypothetical protein H5410_003484 [Solanum commersonii]|uniref:Uncharacterized protein n=1 Tax=Solanum commersonii TaxID=4109 RepID=A0A9J6B5S7_SOLCO|nr:hypothetical protein H5410_003484 [Solanum commersonii]
MVSEIPLGAVSHDHRCTWRSTLWSASSPFSFCLQHLRVLNHWAIWCCFADLTLELWARLRPFGDSPNALGYPQAFFSLYFHPPCSFFPSSVHALPQTPNS